MVRQSPCVIYSRLLDIIFCHLPRPEGYYFGAIGYYDKLAESGHLDLQNDESCVTNEAEIDDTLHTTTLLQIKAEAAIDDHALNYPDLRLFLYYVSLRLFYFILIPSR